MGVVKITEAADPDVIRTLGRIEGAVSRINNSLKDISCSAARIADSAERMARALEKLSSDNKAPDAVSSPVIKWESMNQNDMENTYTFKEPEESGERKSSEQLTQDDKFIENILYNPYDWLQT